MTRTLFTNLLAIIAIMCLGIFGCSKKNPTDVGVAPNVPVLLLPADGALDIINEISLGNPSLAWSASSGASSYTLQVSSDSTFSNVVLAKSSITNNSVLIDSLADSSTHYWRVSATNKYGTSAWSSRWSFTTSGCIEWVDVGAGDFTMGSLPTDPGTQTNEQSQHIVCLDAYQISKYEITNGQYKKFMNAGGYTNNNYWTADGWAWRTTNSITEPYFWTSGVSNSGPDFPSYPVVGISWHEAYAFCKWIGGQLPTEAQWEKAARGTLATNYWPWGSAWDAIKCNTYYSTTDTFACSSPVGYFNTGQSSYGIYDMAGNVWEWVNDWYSSSFYNDPNANINPDGPATGSDKIMRGGSYSSPDSTHYRTAKRAFFNPASRYYGLGIRPAK